jgi:arylsulfatase A-like enzyme
MEVYAAMVERMDRGVGQIVDELRRQGQLDNTLIFYLQDNGGCAEEIGRAADRVLPADYRPRKLAADELQKELFAKETRDGRRVRQGPTVLPGPADSYLAYGEGWANVSNTPFREYKHWVHEGGISTPLIVHWPAQLRGDSAVRPGSLVPTPGHLIDIMATCLDVARATAPTRFRGQPITPPEGVSLLPLLRNKPLARTEPLYWEHEGNRAVRDGRWKLVAKGAAAPWELYDIDTDRSELHNLAAQHPERVKKMASQWNAWAKRAQVLPWPW